MYGVIWNSICQFYIVLIRYSMVFTTSVRYWVYGIVFAIVWYGIGYGYLPCVVWYDIYQFCMVLGMGICHAWYGMVFTSLV